MSVIPGERDITFERALELAREHAVRLGSEPVELRLAEGRTLAEDVHVLADHPPFTNAAMDGFAVRAGDTPGLLRVVGESAAGEPWTGRLAAGQALRISTGAAVPDGADAVVRREVADDEGLQVQVPAARAGESVRGRGEDARAGDLLLRSGDRLAAHQLGAIAGAGHPFVSCLRRPRVAVLVSGGEVVPVGAPLAPGQVWDVNGTAIPALVAAAGAEVVLCTYVPDDHAATRDALAEALGAADVVLSTGGASVGDHDHLRPALADLGVREVFWGVEIRPGHPLWLGRGEEAVMMALPGNPVSAVVCFSVFGRALLGCADRWAPAPLAVAYRSPTPRTDLIRCAMTADGLVPAALQASHNITSLAVATHIAAVPAGAGEVAAGRSLPAVALRA
ncbi:MAG: molybdopterin molybdotransferase MoeA [Thermoleophilia bacterium]|nr:molybdopterin molybdotransferase MoeA [Thermoleophilia bacterium]